ncbi:SDR family oxidoreductase [Chitinophaga sp. MD30]|uniref:SDR family NAD(P)-dependent oxidoreductase n=1 Tax=Chitinophaga sp. MD30 TaxID=2033437 RepID=UPI0018DEEF08|nr:SDR family NAD(P)-dependent oxidoreductase [Chitinophaga sp. MD30]
MSNPSKYTLITGASSGLGKEFAIQCARKGMNIILIALPGGNTSSLAYHLMLEYQVDVQVFEFDLTDVSLLKCKLEEIMRRYAIDFLINNAGVGGTAAITGAPVDKIDQIILVNVRSTALVTRLLLPHLLQHERSYIMNISSMAAFTPIAYKTVYLPRRHLFLLSPWD